jgi:hypothetical protein
MIKRKHWLDNESECESIEIVRQSGWGSYAISELAELMYQEQKWRELGLSPIRDGVGFVMIRKKKVGSSPPESI